MIPLLHEHQTGISRCRHTRIYVRVPLKKRIFAHIRTTVYIYIIPTYVRGIAQKCRQHSLCCSAVGLMYATLVRATQLPRRSRHRFVLWRSFRHITVVVLELRTSIPTDRLYSQTYYTVGCSIECETTFVADIRDYSARKRSSYV